MTYEVTAIDTFYHAPRPLPPLNFIIDGRERRAHVPTLADEDAHQHLQALMARYGPTLDKYQLAEILHLAVGTLENKIQRGQSPVPVYRAGKQHLADVRDVAAYLEARRREARS
ncbi:MAG: hypothetical protein ACREXU_20895 [Gammaproteobacteria bacterium]